MLMIDVLESRQDIFNPIRTDYADFDVDLQTSFGWDGILEELNVPVGLSVALFAFRSKKIEFDDPAKQAVIDQRLKELDEEALMGAKDAEGFMHYQPQAGLSYCVWKDWQSIRNALKENDAHNKAAAFAHEVYSRQKFDRFKIARTAIAGQVEFVLAC